jgi:hypothetical protein
VAQKPLVIIQRHSTIEFPMDSSTFFWILGIFGIGCGALPEETW